MSLRVLAPGQYSIVVDRGRPRTRSLGVPIGGAADRFALSIGNALVGNGADAAALEICLVGPTLEAQQFVAGVVYGAPFEMRSDRQELSAGRAFTLEPGERLSIGACSRDMRAYLCVRGGIQSEIILGSRSAFEPIEKDQVLECPSGRMLGRHVEMERDWEVSSSSAKILRVLPGAQAAWFSEDMLAEPTIYRVTPTSNRMGLRLEGPGLSVPVWEMVSEPVCPGSVQVTRAGQCIILGVDGQTIGGYPKIAQVIASDIDLLGQLRPGDEITFRLVSMDEAERTSAKKRASLAYWSKRLTETLSLVLPNPQL